MVWKREEGAKYSSSFYLKNVFGSIEACLGEKGCGIGFFAVIFSPKILKKAEEI